MKFLGEDSISASLRRYFEREAYQEAIAFLESCLHQDNGGEVSLVLEIYRGIAFLFAGNESRAAEIWFNLLLEGDENTVAVFRTILKSEAQIQLQKHYFTNAQRLYEQLIDLDTADSQSYLALGDSLAQQGKLKEAIATWQKILDREPHHTQAYQKQALTWQKLGEYPLAIKAYHRLLRDRPQDLSNIYNLALCYCANEQLEEAKEYFQLCLDLNPEFSQAYLDLGYCFLKQEQIETTLDLWQKAITIKPQFFQDYLVWAEQLKDNSDFSQSKVYFNLKLLEKLQANSKVENIYFDLAKFLENNHILIQEIANICYKKTLEHYPNLTEIYVNLILNLIKTNQLGEIKYYLDKLMIVNLEKAQELRKIINSSNRVHKSIQISKRREILAPQTYIETALNWSKKYGLTKTNYFAIYPETTIKLKPPLTLDLDIHFSFRFSEPITLPSSFVVKIPQGSFWLREDEASSAVITPDNHIIGDLSPESPALSPGHPDKHPRHHSIFKRSFLPEVEYIDGSVVVLAGLLNNIYFHWLFDILPRIKLLTSINLDFDRVDYFLCDSRCGFQKETLSNFGINPDNILPIENYKHVRAKNLIVPSYPSAIAWMPLWVCNFLKTSFLTVTEISRTPKKRIYIRRNKSSNRRLINEEEIIQFLSKYNFEPVNLELMSVREQAKLLSEAEIVISPHGSGLSNLVFCQKGTKVVEIFAPFYVYPCYWLVSNLVQLEYYYVIGEILGSWHFHRLMYPDSRAEEIYVNCAKLAKILETII